MTGDVGRPPAISSGFIVRETADGLGIVVPRVRNATPLLVLALALLFWIGFAAFLSRVEFPDQDDAGPAGEEPGHHVA